MKRKHKNISIAALVAAMALSGWVLPACATKKNEVLVPDNVAGGNVDSDEENVTEREPGENDQTVLVTPPKVESAQYIKVTSAGVNIRAGAGTGYSSLGTAETDTLYAMCGKTGEWYKTYYKNRTAYISAKYCSPVHMDKSADERIEQIIVEGCKCLGVKYVYGAVRYHDGNGNRLSGFTTSAFDCSSLMQYMFKLGAGVNLQVNTRTQIYQGTTVKKSALKRGDLMFFTNASRKNNTGVERVGHVAMYLGGNYILHTASDYAKIEQISDTRWGYYIQSQRML